MRHGNLPSNTGSPQAAIRTCGPCTACCSVMRVAALGKPAGVPCRNLVAQKCGVYAHRPEACRGFTCLWLADNRGRLDPSHRPDLVGLVLTEADHGAPASVRVAAREVFPGAAATPPAADLIAAMRRFVPVVIVPAAARNRVTLTHDGRDVNSAA